MQIIEAGLRTRASNGGLMDLNDAKTAVQDLRGYAFRLFCYFVLFGWFFFFKNKIK